MKTEVGVGETQCMLSSSRSRDLLLGFAGGFSPDEATEAIGSDSDDIELGLSLGGCFNSANSQKNRILRTSSIPAILPCEVPQMIPLFRTCSLPVDEMQGKMEAKRKGEERRSFVSFGERVDEELEEGPVLKLRRFEIENEGSWIRAGDPASVISSPVTSRWIDGAGMSSMLMKGVAPASQGSVVTEGSYSSGGSELESRSGQAAQISKPINGTAISTGFVSNETLLRNNNGGRCSYESGQLSKSMKKEMPLVSTKGDGRNSRRIEGFLYKYGRGEEVMIVCVCHGSFFTPAEFVKHAGGGDVTYPLRHIVVNPNSAAFL